MGGGGALCLSVGVKRGGKLSHYICYPPAGALIPPLGSIQALGKGHQVWRLGFSGFSVLFSYSFAPPIPGPFKEPGWLGWGGVAYLASLVAKVVNCSNVCTGIFLPFDVANPSPVSQVRISVPDASTVKVMAGAVLVVVFIWLFIV